MHGIPYGPEEPTSYFVGYKCPYEYNLYSFIITLFLAVIVSYAWFVRRSHPCGAIYLLFFYPEWTMTATRRYNFKSKHIGYTLWHHKKNHEWNMQLSFPITKFIQKREDRKKTLFIPRAIATDTICIIWSRIRIIHLLASSKNMSYNFYRMI